MRKSERLVAALCAAAHWCAGVASSFFGIPSVSTFCDLCFCLRLTPSQLHSLAGGQWALQEAEGHPGAAYVTRGALQQATRRCRARLRRAARHAAAAWPPQLVRAANAIAQQAHLAAQPSGSCATLPAQCWQPRIRMLHQPGAQPDAVTRGCAVRPAMQPQHGVHNL
jgi:hypothetical protein